MARLGSPPSSIEYQYDVGNDFFARFLDPTMSYSCALWDDNNLTLQEAQRRKIAYHIGAACATGADNVLDVGCGWGGVLRALVEDHGVQRAVGLTLSQQQHEWIQTKEWDGVEVRLESWEQHEPITHYDAIISVGAFEHFARPDLDPRDKLEAYRSFFRHCYDWLQPGGRLSLQTMALQNVSNELVALVSRYSARYIPDSTAPLIEEVTLAAGEWFNLQAVRCDGEMYARTMREWRHGLNAARDDLAQSYGPAMVRRFQQTFRAAEMFFERGLITLYRLVFERRRRPRQSPITEALGLSEPPAAASHKAATTLLNELLTNP